MKLWVNLLLAVVIFVRNMRICAFIAEGQSEVVKVPTMGSYSGYSDTKINCPYNASNLQRFEKIFNNIDNGSDVIIDGRKQILLQSSILLSNNFFLNRLIIKSGSSLIFADANIHLNVREIFIASGGSLLMGSETCRIQSQINITFYGSSQDSAAVDSSDGTGLTSKGIIAYGRLDMHGKKYHPTWTKLSQTAMTGSNVIYIQSLVNWVVGQQIVITTSNYYDCPDEWQAAAWCPVSHQNEVLTITAIDPTSRTITFSPALKNYHYAGLEYQAEVALLSRNIHLQGSFSNKFGGHVTIKEQMALGRISGVRADNFGQLNVLGRYPFHFHLLGDTKNSSLSYFQECSVTNSNFRCYVIHGTNSTRISRNVAYNVKGNCYYIEDGVEEKNTLEYNLAALISPIYRPAQGPSGQGGETFSSSNALIVPADTAAAGFYVSNAMNSFVGNAASGGWTGFAFPNLPEPTGVFKGSVPLGSPYAPQNRPLLKFDGNTAHSSGYYWADNGMCMYTGAKLFYYNGVLTYNSGRNARSTTYGNGSASTMILRNSKAYLCNRGIGHWGLNVVLDTAEVHDAGIAAFLFGQAAVRNLLINMRSGNPKASSYLQYYQQIGFQFYDTYTQTIFTNVTFRWSKNAIGTYCAIRFMDTSDHYLPQGLNSAKNVKYENICATCRICLTSCGKQCNTTRTSISSTLQSIWDWDGSVSGTGVPTIIGSRSDWWNADSSCTKDAYSKMWFCPWSVEAFGGSQPTLLNPSKTSSAMALTTNRTIGFIELAVAGLTGACDATKYSSCSDQQAPYRVGRVSQWGSSAANKYVDLGPWPGVTGITNTGWYWRTNAPGYNISGAPSAFKIGNSMQLAPRSFIVLAIAYPSASKFTVTLNYYGSGTARLSIPMATSLRRVLSNTEPLVPPSQYSCPGSANSLCTYTGGVGPAWYFDGSFLYVRVVPFMCYYKSTVSSCWSNSFNAFGIKVWGVNDYKWSLAVNASCPGCSVQSSYAGVTYWTARDASPAAPLLLYSPCPTAAPSASPSAPSTSPSVKPIAPGSTGGASSRGAVSCFSGSDWVWAEAGTAKLLSDVRVGDRVLAYSTRTRAPVYSSVIAVPHLRNDVTASFVEVVTESSVVKLTPEHLILSGECGSRLTLRGASEVRPENCVRTVSGEEAVSAVSLVSAKGLYTIVATEELIIVSGVVVSPFAVSHSMGHWYYTAHRTLFKLAPYLLRTPFVQYLTNAIAELLYVLS